jgi:hypothetical protein
MHSLQVTLVLCAAVSIAAAAVVAVALRRRPDRLRESTTLPPSPRVNIIRELSAKGHPEYRESTRAEGF